MIKNIIWDVDGTLFDTYPAITGAVRSALQELGKDSDPARITALAKESLSRTASALAEEHHLNADDLSRVFLEHYDRLPLSSQPPFPGVKTLCAYVLSIGGKNAIVTHRGPQGTAGLLEAAGMTGLFAGWITRADGFPRKPDPAAFLAALQTHGLAAEETLTVGDREIDISAGRAAGVRTCLFRGESAATAADLAVEEYSELQRYILKVNGGG